MGTKADIQKEQSHVHPEQRQSVDKGNTGHFQQVTVIRHVNYPVLRIYGGQGLFELYYITNI